MKKMDFVKHLSHRSTGALVAAVLCLSLSACGSSSNSSDGAGGSAGSTGSGGAAGSSSNPNLAKFSFFVISVGSVRTLSGSQKGFGGDLRFGETGEGAGLRGADKICAAAAELGMAGAGKKTWRAFLSTTGGSGGTPVNASSRVGSGPWYDAQGRLVASNLSQLLMDRPGDADLQIKNDLPNEFGTPNHEDGGCSGGACPANHDILTGTGPDGMLYTAVTPITDSTCNDWTSSEPTGKPWCGHSWPRTGSGTNWMSSTSLDGCAPCTGLGSDTNCVGDTGGYGAFYCFATN
jgi:hypothetical protein